MKATEAQLLTFMKKSPQFVIPIYQRTYSWTEKQCRQLWADLMRAGSSEKIGVHFVGSIVYVEDGLSQVSHQAPLLVIDGQQRLTTISLLIEALARALGTTEPIDGFSAKKLRNYYLLNPEEDGARYFKLVLSQTDSASLHSLIGQRELPPEPSVRIVQNFELFTNLIADNSADIATLCHGISKLVVVDVALSRGQDNPQLIFESMNSTGKELSQADLIRNYVLMDLEPQLQTRLYEQYWRPMEREFGQDAYGSQFDGFMRHFLTVRTGDIPRESDVYEEFKTYAKSQPVSALGTEALVKDIRSFARYFCAMALGQESDPSLAAAFKDLRELKVEVAYPLLLELYHDVVEDRLSNHDFEKMIRLIESYVFRRAICAIPTNSLNKTFSGFTRVLDKSRYLESFEAHLLLLPSYRRFPSDDEFGRDIQTRDLYRFRSRSYWLRRFENYDRKERVPVDEYTIEHIMPQNPELSAAWRADLGSEWERVQSEWLHTLGNLTLTGYNAEYSDRPFGEKRDMAGGFRESPLRLNAGLATQPVWDESAIKARAQRLAQQALKVWPSPTLSSADALNYRPEDGRPRMPYSIDDHPNLALPEVQALYESIRLEILSLDPCVTEEFRKLYVAYKAETNFVDIVPQQKRLRLTINLPFHEIDDPEGRCRDVSSIGRWGNGDTECVIQSPGDIAYAMRIIRQAFDLQMSET